MWKNVVWSVFEANYVARRADYCGDATLKTTRTMFFALFKLRMACLAKKVICSVCNSESKIGYFNKRYFICFFSCLHEKHVCFFKTFVI